MAVIEEIINLEGLSDHAKDKVVNYREDPPNLGNCLAVLAEADESLRIGLMMNLIDTSWANEELDPLEMAALKLAPRSLNISDVELESIEGFECQQDVDYRHAAPTLQNIRKKAE